MKLGTFVRRTRRERGFSLSEVARRIGVSPSYLCRIERNDPDRHASDRLLARLARELALPVDDVFTFARRLPPDITRWLVKNPQALARVRAEMRPS